MNDNQWTKRTVRWNYFYVGVTWNTSFELCGCGKVRTEKDGNVVSCIDEEKIRNDDGWSKHLDICKKEKITLLTSN